MTHLVPLRPADWTKAEKQMIVNALRDAHRLAQEDKMLGGRPSVARYKGMLIMLELMAPDDWQDLRDRAERIG